MVNSTNGGSVSDTYTCVCKIILKALNFGRGKNVRCSLIRHTVPTLSDPELRGGGKAWGGGVILGMTPHKGFEFWKR